MVTSRRNSFSRTPTRTSADTVLSIVHQVGAFYKLPLTCSLDEQARTASIDLSQNTITLPAYLTKANLPKILFYSEHEILHAIKMPRTAHMQAYYVALAAEKGVKAPETLANLVFDQDVNNHGMIESPFREEFRKGCAAFYHDRTLRLKQYSPQWASWHFGNMNRRCAEILGKAKREKTPPPEVMSKLYTLIFKDERPFEARYKDVCEITKDWFEENEDCSDAPSPCGQNSLPPIRDPKELEEWIKKIRTLSRKSGIRGARASGSKRVLMDYAEIASLEEYIISQQNRVRKSKATGGPESPDAMWTPADRIDELDLRLTLQTSGIFLPYVTALKRVAGADTTEEAQGSGLQAYILDVSGSMYGNLDLVAMLCFAISRNAKRKLDEVAILTFSDANSPEFLLKPGREYDRMRPILEKLEGGGSTYLAPALEWLNKYCTEKRLKPTAIIFTDTAIGDPDESLLELQITREKLHGTSILINTEAYALDWVSAAKHRGFLEAFRVNSDHLGDVQRILTHIT